jgi:hypothetical protein
MTLSNSSDALVTAAMVLLCIAALGLVVVAARRQPRRSSSRVLSRTSPLGRAAVLLSIVAMAATSLWSGGISNAVIDAPGVTGTVRLDGGGVSGATVEVIDSGIIVGTATTTGSGAFEIPLASPGDVDLRVTPPAGLGASAQTITDVVVPPAPTFATVDDVDVEGCEEPATRQPASS